MSWPILPLLPLLPLLALALDMVFKDPPGWPHPVRLLGLMADRLEGMARWMGSPLRLLGAVCVILTALAAWAVVMALISLPLIGWAMALYFSYAGLALGSLLQEGGRVAGLLRCGQVEHARSVLAGLVSRDVANLDEDALRRTLAETVSENLNDAFIAPFCFLLFFGPAGLWVYKAVSTMDSMWGYVDERWRELGWAAAKSDDLLAFIPARITAAAMLLCARIMGLATVPSWKRLAGHAARTESPNAGWPMAAAALSLNAGVGGPASYCGRIKEKPWLGPQSVRWDDEKIVQLLTLVRNAGLGFAFAGSMIFFALAVRG